MAPTQLAAILFGLVVDQTRNLVQPVLGEVAQRKAHNYGAAIPA
jgi:hypothetical protein